MKITKIISALALSLVAVQGLFASNTVTKVAQVVEGVTVSADVDYTITGQEPFTTAGSVNITNTEHAVVIIQKIKPSKVISTWLRNHVYINGVQAVNGSNCQVKMYASGAIIFPYASSIKPLTVFSEKNFEGTSVNSFGLESDNGYMNTLTADKLNNNIHSFKLKRGYMVTFSTLPGGRGYSRCFIADKADLEISELPAVLNGTISSYRVFHWYNAKKAGLASDLRTEALSATNASWCYTWGVGESRLPDVECVPNHIYEDWPSSRECGNATFSCHLKTNNEPGNSADDHPQDVATVLANWENLMRTGLRLCSESSHDGSMGHLKAFIDSIDARGWRCDILDLHCYWPSGSFDNLNNYSNNYGNGRPIWISEWVWGASWNNNGAFAVSDRGAYEANWSNNYNGTKPILDKLNANSKVERYAFWNSEANCSKIYLDGKLSTLGEYYAKMDDGLGYNPANEFIPRNPRQYSPSNLVAEYDKTSKKVRLTWHDGNGEYNQNMTIQLRKPGTTTWTSVATPEQQEAPADYELTLDGLDGYKYRVYVQDVNGKKCYSNEATAVNDELAVGDAVTVGENTLFIGGNMLVNGDFELGLTDWQNGAGEPLSAPYFEAVPMGGVDGGAYLQAYGDSKDKLAKQSLRKVITLQRYHNYYVQAAGSNGGGSGQKIASTSSASFELNTRISLPAITQWAKQGVGFRTTTDSILTIQFRECGGKSQFDEIIVSRLFQTQDSALADALECAKMRAEAFKQYNTSCPSLNDEIDELISTAANHADIENGVMTALAAIKASALLPSLIKDAENAIAFMATNSSEIKAAIEDAKKSVTAAAIVESVSALQEALNGAFPYVLDKETIANPSFAGAIGWTTKAGTYTAGDQRTATQAGKTCWNAWWNTSAAGGAATTMAINQEVKGLKHGFYALEAKATTQHYCVADQKAYLTADGQTVYSPRLSYGVLDLPTVADADKWETLVTPYIYVPEKGDLTVGFIGTKEGAKDKTWMAYNNPSNTGDNREGWWCATDFYLRRVPAYCEQVGETGWGTICLTGAFPVPDGVQLYKVAGILADSTRICLEPVTSTIAGNPYIYRTQLKEIYFYEDGTIASGKTVNGVRGMLSTTSKIPVSSLDLVGDRWTFIKTSADRTPLKSFGSFIYKLGDVPVLESWDGEVMWTKDLVSEEKIKETQNATAIDAVQSANAAASPVYNMAGQRVKPNAKGIVISKNRKTLRK